MSKTPFEIRVEILNMATSQLVGQYYADLERAREIADPSLKEIKIRELIYPSTDQIFGLARELKQFVDNA
jgi:hypothetical protein